MTQTKGKTDASEDKDGGPSKTGSKRKAAAIAPKAAVKPATKARAKKSQAVEEEEDELVGSSNTISAVEDAPDTEDELTEKAPPKKRSKVAKRSKNASIEAEEPKESSAKNAKPPPSPPRPTSARQKNAATRQRSQSVNVPAADAMESEIEVEDAASVPVLEDKRKAGTKPKPAVKANLKQAEENYPAPTKGKPTTKRASPLPATPASEDSMRNSTGASREDAEAELLHQAAAPSHRKAGRAIPVGEASKAEDGVTLESALGDTERQQLTDTIIELRARYDELKDVGVKQAEESFAQYKITAEARFKASEEYDAQLQAEIQSLREKLQAGVSGNKAIRRQLKETEAERDEARRALAESHEKAAAHSIKNKAVEAEKEKPVASDADRENLKELKAAAEQAQGQVKQMEEEAVKFRAKAKQQKQSITALSEELRVATSQVQRLQQHDRYLITVERMVRMYEELTGVTIQSVEDVAWPAVDDDEEQEGRDAAEETPEIPAIVFKCKHKGRLGALDYNLYTPSETALPTAEPIEYLCEPVSARGVQGRGTVDLPAFLAGPLTFDKRMCDMFFWRACHYLQKTDD